MHKVERALRDHDWYHAMSDSYSVHMAGEASQCHIQQFASDNGLTQDEFDEMFRRQCPYPQEKTLTEPALRPWRIK